MSLDPRKPQGQSGLHANYQVNETASMADGSSTEKRNDGRSVSASGASLPSTAPQSREVDTASSLPLPSEPSTTRQERAQRYLERKKQRQDQDTGAQQPVTPPPVRAVPNPVTPPPVRAIPNPVTPPPIATVQAPPHAKPVPATPALDPEGIARQRFHRRWRLRHIARVHMRTTRRQSRRTATSIWLAVGSVALVMLVMFLSVSSAAGYTAYRLYSGTQQQYQQKVLSLRDLMPKDNLKMYDKNGVPIAELIDQGLHTTVPLEKVSPHLVNATVATEDKNFWTNEGVDIPRIIRAAFDDLSSGHVVAGGSTITQQLIKNLVVGNETTVTRKLEEIMLTPSVNNHYSKHDIMEMYLNSIYYGEQAYGIDAAARVYFGLQDTPNKTAASQLDIAQSAMLAGLPSSPSAYDPRVHPAVAFQRFETVLDLMVGAGYITRVQALDAIKEAQQTNFLKLPNIPNRAPHFANFVLTQLEQTFHLTREQLSRSDMNVYTTLNIGLQDQIQKIAQQHIAELRDDHNVSNAAEVLIDFHTGAIISLLGSIDYNNKSIDGQYDVATQAYRQPGSSFKPYVYVTAFAQGVSPGQAINDAPIAIPVPGSDPPVYSPTNYDLHFHGQMTLRCALQNSLNVPAVKVLQHVGISAAMKTAHDMGVTTYQGTPGYSLVLGGLGVRLIDHTSAIGTFADGGVHVPYYSVQKVVFPTSHKTYNHPPSKGQRIISPQLAYMMTNVLSDNNARLPEFFDCNVLQLYSNSQQDCYDGDRGAVRPAAAKTGTTSDFRDNWTVGYTTDYVMGVWAGNDDNTPMYDVTGVQGAAPIWHDSMLLAERGHPIRDFVNPGGLQMKPMTFSDGVQTTDLALANGGPQADASNLPILVSQDQLTLGKLPPPTRVVQAAPYCPSAYSFGPVPPGSPGAW